ncbi:MAG TPA: aminotransferase class IV, partial [Planctomycetaceae bacterium]
MPAQHVAWIDGRYVPLAEAALSVFDAGVTTGATVTERLRTFRHEPFLLDEHVSRLADSAAAAFVPLRAPPGEIAALIREVVRRNAALLPAEDDLAVAAFATPGTEAGPTLCVHATPIPARLYAEAYEDGIRLVTPPTRAMPAETLSPQIKTRSRLHWHVADAQAERTEPGAKAL